MNDYTYISLFSGAGGLDLGFNEAGFRGMFASDIMANAKSTYIYNNPSSTYILKDICELSASEIRSHLSSTKIDVILGGPPCQGYSNMGNKNSADPRNMLFKNYVRIAESLKTISLVRY